MHFPDACPVAAVTGK